MIETVVMQNAKILLSNVPKIANLKCKDELTSSACTVRDPKMEGLLSLKCQYKHILSFFEFGKERRKETALIFFYLIGDFGLQ